MLRSLKDLERYGVSASNGDIGNVANFLFDDERWTIRYLVVNTGGGIGGRQVLISPVSFRQADWANGRFHLALTIDEVRGSPDIDSNKPVSRQNERTLNTYYGYPHYWGDTGEWGMGSTPASLAPLQGGDAPAPIAERPGDAHLRSIDEVRGYHIQGNDAATGHIEDFIVDDTTWEVRYLVVDTSNWWLGQRVLISPHWAKRVSWSERKVYVALSREAIKSSPEWIATAPVNREYETRLYDYYGRPVYWATAKDFVNLQTPARDDDARPA